MVGKVWGLTCGGRTPPNSVGLTGSTSLHEHNQQKQKHIQHTNISTRTPNNTSTTGTTGTNSTGRCTFSIQLTQAQVQLGKAQVAQQAAQTLPENSRERGGGTYWR